MAIQPPSDDEVAAIWAATLADEIPATTAFPQPDLTFLPPLPPQALPFAAIQAMVAEGLAYLSDQLYGVFALVGRSLQGQPVTVTFSRSHAQPATREATPDATSVVPGAVLLRYELGHREGFAWEMEVTATVETATLCTVEVSLFDPTRQLSVIPITLYDGLTVHTQPTNQSGTAIFPNIARQQLAHLIIHHALDG